MRICKDTTIRGRCCKHHRNSQGGLTVLELMIAVGIIGILTAIAVPSIINWLPNYSLKAAARDLVLNMQKARMQAVKENKKIKIRFDSSIKPGFYYFDTDNNKHYTRGEYRIDLSSYGSGVDYGTGNAALNWNGDNCTQAGYISFNSRGTSNSGTIYIQNKNNDICYAISVRISGSIRLRKYNGRLPFNKNNWH